MPRPTMREVRRNPAAREHPTLLEPPSYTIHQALRNGAPEERSNENS
jgi:hypothetical protein